MKLVNCKGGGGTCRHDGPSVKLSQSSVSVCFPLLKLRVCAPTSSRQQGRGARAYVSFVWPNKNLVQLRNFRMVALVL